MKLMVYTPDGNMTSYEPEIGMEWPVCPLLFIPQTQEYRLLYATLITDKIDRYDYTRGEFGYMQRVPKLVLEDLKVEANLAYAPKGPAGSCLRLTSSGPIQLNTSIQEMHADLFEYL
jgi:hypothetical protein